MKKTTSRNLVFIGLGVLILAFIVPGIIAYNQDKIVDQLISQANRNIKGKIELQGSHISLFENFPYISIDLEALRLLQDKSDTSAVIFSTRDAYIGFDALKLIQGKIEIKAISIADADIFLIQDEQGTYNFENVIEPGESTDTTTTGSPVNLSIDKISLSNVEFFKKSEYNKLLVDLLIEKLDSKLKYSDEHIYFDINTDAILTFVNDGDTAFFHDKHLSLAAQLDYFGSNETLTISPSTLKLENVEMTAQGTIDFANDTELDIKIEGEKDNFDLLLAFAPPEIYPSLANYENGGAIFFNSRIKGKSTGNNYPSLEASFGCKEAYIRNSTAGKTIEEMTFMGSFTAESLGDLSTMSFSLKDFRAKPEAGTFIGNLQVSNFDSPDIEMQLDSRFNLDFLVDFLNVKDLEDLAGSVDIKMNFHDIIDLNQPEKSLDKLNESYFTQIRVDDLSFSSPDLPVPVKNFNLKADIEGNKASIDTLYVRAGSSDIRLSGFISDLPSVIHHTNTPVDIALFIESDTLDLEEITKVDSISSAVQEVITGFSTELTFTASARAFTESPNLPIGEFFIKKLNADLSKYPHSLHDFTADVLIDSVDFKVLDFSGMIDDSDFHFDGTLANYDLWFQEVPKGDTRVDFSLTSSLLRLEDLFAYGGENHVPEDYRHEEFSDLTVMGSIELHYDSLLASSDLYIEDITTTMKVHPLKFRDFKGRIHLEDKVLTVENLGGKLGNSSLDIDYRTYLGEDSISNLSIRADQLDFDQLTNYNPPPADYQATPEDHEAVFNIFDVPFPDMVVSASINKLNYHRYLIEDFQLEGRIQKDHYIYLDSLGLRTAGGTITGKGYFNGSDRNLIYFSPDFMIENLALDQILFKFENFGQDQLVSDNLSGLLTASLNGKIHVHPDLVPIIDDSELTIDLLVKNGELIDFPVMLAMSDYFKDRNLSRVRFDTLQNQLSLNNGVLKIPRMNINSTIGFFEIQGEQGTDMSMDYLVRIPWSLVTSAAKQKLFGKKDGTIDESQVDEIQFQEEGKNVRFVNIRISGTTDNYEVKLGK